MREKKRRTTSDDAVDVFASFRVLDVVVFPVRLLEQGDQGGRDALWEGVAEEARALRGRGRRRSGRWHHRN